MICIVADYGEAFGLHGVPQQDAAKAKKQIEQLKKLKLIEALNLDDATAEKFFVRYNAEQKKVEDARKALEDAINDLEKAKSSGNTEKIKQLTQIMLDRHKNLQDANNEFLRSVREVLNEKQYADFLVFESKFQKQLAEILSKINTKRD
ncbi:MAG: hypothetical protein RML40_11815 [Bacteroidota bacterium]|nr:hypothetical protein [Candidatus Kapabacteria bacterium]MDW8221202.1 hypothetical protein [Bacteroidota bacterium]